MRKRSVGPARELSIQPDIRGRFVETKLSGHNSLIALDPYHRIGRTNHTLAKASGAYCPRPSENDNQASARANEHHGPWPQKATAPVAAKATAVYARSRRKLKE